MEISAFQPLGVKRNRIKPLNISAGFDMNPKQVIDAKIIHEMNSAALCLTISHSLAR